MKSSKEHRGCVLLKPEENEEVFKLIGNRCQCLAAGVVQLYLTEPPGHREWIKRKSGIITLIRDPPKRSYFLRLYCLNRKAMLWEQELYNSMAYNTPLPYFHTFEGEDCMIAFNFANETEAIIMRSIILERLNANRERRQEKKTKANVESQQRVTLPRRNPSSTQDHSANVLNGMPPSLGMNGGFTGSSTMHKKKNKRDRDQKKKLTAADIGRPSNFRHLAHMGFNANKDLEMDAEDPTLLEFFKTAGITKQHLNSRKTRDFIYNYIDEHGGLSAVQNELQNKSSPAPLPPLVSDSPPPIPARTVTSSPGINNNQSRNTRPPPPTRNNVPPPPPSAPPTHRTLPSRPPPPSAPPTLPPLPAVPPPPPRSTSNTSNVSSTSSSSTAPPPAVGPPPPPPPPPLPPPPPPDFKETDAATTNNNSPSVPDLRPQLMDAIRSGTTLKKVEPVERKPAAVPDSRNNLLEEIRQGVRLKTVTDEVKTSSPPATEQGGLAGGLSKALAERFKQLGYSEESQDESSDTSDYDEWDD